MNQNSSADNSSTDSSNKASVGKSPGELESIVQNNFPTSGSSYETEAFYYLLPDKINILKNIFGKIDAIEDSIVKSQVKRFVFQFQSTLLSKKPYLENVGQLPIASIIQLADKSALLEWGFKDFKIGFSFEPDPNESSWYLVSNKNLNEISSSGPVNEKAIQDIISFVFNFVASNT